MKPDRKICHRHNCNDCLTCNECYANTHHNAAIDAYNAFVRENIPTVESIADVLISKHCYINFNSDKDIFVTVPIKECSEAVHALITRRLGIKEPKR